MSLELSKCERMYVYVYIHVYIYICVCVFLHVPVSVSVSVYICVSGDTHQPKGCRCDRLSIPET